MLNLILGRKLSHKTKYWTDKAAKLCGLGKDVVILVPEQFSFECQKLLLSELGPSVSNKIQIHSFTSLCKEISIDIGGLSGKTVDEGIRFLLVGKALQNVSDHLKYYARYVNSREFQLKVMIVINELKQAFVSCDDLKVLSEKVVSTVFKDKLSDIALILSAYDVLLKNRFVEPLDIYSKTVERLKDNSWFSGKTFIIDEFKGFTAAQFALLDRIIAGCDDVYATFCCDTETPQNDTDIFKNVISSTNELKRLAKSHGVSVAEDVILESDGYKSDALSHLERLLAQKTCEKFVDETDDITICKADSIYDEVDFCMLNIRRLVREKGYRYNDFVIISRNSSMYTTLISDVSVKYSIPCLTDGKVPLCELPFSIFVLSALNSVLHFETSQILRYLKTGLTLLSDSDVLKIENYAFVWNINGNKWLKPWCLNPDGLRGNNKTFENAELNEARQKIVSPLVFLKKSLNGTVSDLCKATYKFIENSQVIEQLKKYTNGLELNGELDHAQYQRTGYDVFIKVLDKLCAVSGNEMITAEDFVLMLQSALQFETVGEIPRTKEQVIYGTADRIRPLRPKVVFVLGANHDVFPAVIGDSGVFSQSEREVMKNNNINVADFGLDDTLDEKFLFYSAVTCASEKVFLSYSAYSSDNTEMLPSEEVNTIINEFPNCKKVCYGLLSNFDLEHIEAPASAFEKFAVNYGCQSSFTRGLRKVFDKDNDYSNRLSALDNSVRDNIQNISKNAAIQLFGDELNLSPSKIEEFNKCHFAFFCKYGLKAQKLEKVDFTAATRGNIIHYCLEKFITNHFEDIGTLDNDSVKAEVTALCDEYLSVSGVEIDDLGEKFDYMLSVLKGTAVFIAQALNNEFAQSEFKPKFCELKVGRKGVVPSVVVIADNGVKISLEGTVDRVDTTEDGKVRVVDYKTGIKEFKLSSVLDGMNMQMLLYLYSLVSNAKDLLKSDIPAGILYFPARRQISDNVSDGYVKMNGLINSDPKTLQQMEKNLSGKIIPAKMKSNGGFTGAESLATTNDFKLIFKYLDCVLAKIGAKITGGDIEILPYKKGDKLSCEYCDYKSVCRINDDRLYREEVKLKTADALEIMNNEIKG